MNIDDWLKKLNRKVVAVYCPEVEQKVHVRSLSAAELRANSEASEGKDELETTAIALASTVSDADGNQLLTLEQARQIAAAEDSRFARRLISAGSSLIALDDKALEETQGN